MARFSKSEITKLQIVRVASQQFLDNGYSNTSAKAVCRELDMSPGNLTFYFPTKEHLLCELVELLCRFQWKMMNEEAKEGLSSVMAICLEISAMAVMCEENEAVRDVYLTTYQSPMCLEIIRKNDMRRAKEVFRDFCPHWQDESFAEAEILVSGIEYATFTSWGGAVPLETRIRGAINQILTIYNVPRELREQKTDRVLSMDYRELGRRMLSEFKKYVKEANEQALLELLKL